MSPDIDELKTKRLCYQCVGEDYLRDEIQREGEIHDCSYCGETENSYSIAEMAERINTVFDQHFMRTSDQPNSLQQRMLSDRESSYDWDRDGEPVVQAIAGAAEIPEEAAEDIQAILSDDYENYDSFELGEETEFSSDSYYEEKGTSDEAWQEQWRAFEHSLKTEARFFSRAAASLLASVFGAIDQLYTADGRPLVRVVGPSTELRSIYRARVFQSDDSLTAALCRPDQHLGSPPPPLASAGRMNARGISVFYGANEVAVAIAEVRPPVGSQVVIGRFDVIRALRLLDLTALGAAKDEGSVFDPNLAGRLERVMFLRSLSRRMSKPVMPDDEAFEYLATQAVADFLATENEPQLDGIIFPSVQAAGNWVNVTLFHKSARIEALDVPEGTEISASTSEDYEDGPEAEYSVIERVPESHAMADEESAALGRLHTFAEAPYGDTDWDRRPITLRVDCTSVKVHVVQSVKFDTAEYEVRRVRWPKSAPQF